MLNAFLDKLPPGPIMIFGGLYFFMPIVPEPHLVQKYMMIRDGVPLAPLDIFDIFVHSLGGVMAVLMFLRQRQLMAQDGSQDGDHDGAKDKNSDGAPGED